MTTKELTLDKGHWGINAGLTANYTFKNHIVCETGIRISDKGSDELKNFDPQWQHFVAKLTLDRMNYLEIPLMIGYQFKLTKSVHITPKAGAYCAIGLNGKGFIENADDTFGCIIDSFQDNKLTLGNGEEETFTKYDRMDYGLSIAAEIKFKQIVCRIAYGRSFSPIFNTYDSANKHQTLSMSLGYYLFKNAKESR